MLEFGFGYIDSDESLRHTNGDIKQVASMRLEFGSYKSGTHLCFHVILI